MWDKFWSYDDPCWLHISASLAAMSSNIWNVSQVCTHILMLCLDPRCICYNETYDLERAGCPWMDVWIGGGETVREGTEGVGRWIGWTIVCGKATLFPFSGDKIEGGVGWRDCLSSWEVWDRVRWLTGTSLESDTLEREWKRNEVEWNGI